MYKKGASTQRYSEVKRRNFLGPHRRIKCMHPMLSTTFTFIDFFGLAHFLRIDIRKSQPSLMWFILRI